MSSRPIRVPIAEEGAHARTYFFARPAPLPPPLLVAATSADADAAP
jgi:hypothetical protein